MTEKTSKISGFYKLGIDERLKIVQQFADLTDEELSLLKKEGPLAPEQADRMVENVIGTMPLPLGIAVNFQINGKDYLVPMALEEPSVVAAASNAAKLARETGGFKTDSTDPVMIGQIHLMDLKDPEAAKSKILENKQKYLELANSKDPLLVKFGGGARDIDATVLQTEQGTLVRIHVYVDCRDAMGANAINTMVEALTPEIESLTGGKAYLKIISNLADRRLSRATVTFDKESIGGEQVVDAIVKTYAIAAADPYRAATNNKGIMNAVSAITVAAGNDSRAIESGAHAYAGRGEGYKPLAKWEKNTEGNLVGSIELPTAIGLVGGATKVHPVAKICVKILGVKSASELGEILAAVGLAQNFAAIRAISQEGIQRGHMKLHARNLAASVGAKDEQIDKIAAKMIEEKQVSMARAKELLEEFSS